MHTKLPRYIYRSSLIGLLSTSALLALSTATLADSANGHSQLPLPVLLANNKMANQNTGKTTSVKEIVRQITYIDPLTKQRHTIRQVATFPVDHHGKVAKGTTSAWQAYFLPYFSGYEPTDVEVQPAIVTPDTPPVNVLISYHRLVDIYPANNTIFDFKTVDGEDLIQDMVIIQPQAGHHLTTVKLPPAPRGWEYVDADQLPSTINVTPGQSKEFTLMVKKLTAHHQEKRLLWRKIVLHFPTGDQTIMQQAVASREITTTFDQKEVGDWQISPFNELTLPPIAGYEASADSVPALQLTADQLQAPVTPVEIHYHRTTVDQGTATAPSKDEGTMTTPVATKDDGSQTDPVGQKDAGTQTDTQVGKTEATQTDAQTGKDEATQTSTQTSKNEGTQTDQPTMVDAASGDCAVGGVDQGTQTKVTPTADAGTGDDAVNSHDEETQTAQASTTETGTGDSTVTTTDRGTQTHSPTMVDTGVGDGLIDTHDEKVQTAQTPTVETGVGDDSIMTADQGTQTTQTLTTDEGSGDDRLAVTDQGTQTHSPATVDTGVGDGSIDTHDEKAQTPQTPTVETGIGDDSIMTADQGSQTTKTASIETGVGDGSVVTKNTGTQTTLPLVTDTSADNSSAKNANQVTQPDNPITDDEKRGGDNSADSRDQGVQPGQVADHATSNTTDISNTDHREIDSSKPTDAVSANDKGALKGVVQNDGEVQLTAPTADDQNISNVNADHVTQPGCISINGVGNKPQTTQGDKAKENGTANVLSTGELEAQDTVLPAPQASSETVGNQEGKRQPIEKQLADQPQADNSAELDPLAFHNDLKSLQDPLTQLTAPHGQTSPIKLPQTGSQPTNIRTTFFALIATLVTTGLGLFTLKRKN